MGEGKVAVIEQLVIAGVAITARALADVDGIDLTFPQWRVLVVLGERPEGATVSEVAGRIGVTLPATSRQLRRLQNRALVRVEPDGLDRRATRARLTPDGERVRRRIFGFRRREVERAVANLEIEAGALSQLTLIARAMAGQH